ncbi:DUF58 domain-containing protein [Derxia lacustris]|uniref:DUF58 domain-containing protein n=1 Tax=Derxia lacustris TaxID=764842 RepID=UPI000A16D007|nr:VWA domain-containing protein [Derxia lacustris]
MDEFDYRIRWRSAEVLPGAHRGLRDGAGSEFGGHVGLLGAPDPRRLDLRASIANPGGGWLFRRMRQHSGIGVMLLLDVSASMAAGGARMATLAWLARLIGHSARRGGDSFGAIAADARLRDALHLPPTRAPGAVAEFAARLDAFVPDGHGHAGLVEAADSLAGRRRLVFVASDFCWPLADVDRLLQALAPHQVQPLLLTAGSGLPAGPDGLIEVDDAEGGAGRALWLRPAQRARWQTALADWRRGLAERFAAHGIAPLAAAEPSAEDIGEWLRDSA